MELYDLTPFREAIARARITNQELADRMQVDESRVRHILGTSYTLDRTNGRRYYSKSVTYEVGLKICAALHLDPVDLGL